MIPDYPEFAEMILEQRSLLHPRFRQLADGLSDYSFANLYLFRDTHHFAVSRLGGDLYVFRGRDGERPFFMLPFGLPERSLLEDLFARLGMLKAASERHLLALEAMGYTAEEDRDNFDYLYALKDLQELRGRHYHSKKNLVNAMTREFEIVGRPLLEAFLPDAYRVLDDWRAEHAEEGDAVAAREALEKMEVLQLCGYIYYVGAEPVAYTMGEENNLGRTFDVKFEKAVRADFYKGIYQFVNNAFVNLLPDKYEFVNREQDLGDPGLRQAKMSYRPVGFVKKFRVSR